MDSSDAKNHQVTGCHFSGEKEGQEDEKQCMQQCFCQVERSLAGH